MYINELKDYKLETEQRNKTKCIACGKWKSLGTVLCWDCWYDGNGNKPSYKYFDGNFMEWISIK